MDNNVSRPIGIGRARGMAAALAALCLGFVAGLAPSPPAGDMRQAVPAAYANPVIDANFPDPSVLRDGVTFYAYATNSGPNMPCEKSADLVHWTALPDAMPTLPPWVDPGRTWAPEVRTLTPGKRYIAYFCAHARADDTQAIGVASGPTAAGPFASAATVPLIDQPEAGGVIDPSCFIDGDGTRYLLWKNDGNSKGRDTWLWLQKLSSDGLSLVGPATRLLKQDQAWEGSLIEAPTLWKHGGKYYLFYSANFFGNCSYAMGYAAAESVRGPYTKPRDIPWVASSADVCGPGGADVVTTSDGRAWMVYHTWAKGPNSYRSMSVDPLVWKGDVPSLLGPSHGHQSAPRPASSVKEHTHG